MHFRVLRGLLSRWADHRERTLPGVLRFTARGSEKKVAVSALRAQRLTRETAEPTRLMVGWTRQMTDKAGEGTRAKGHNIVTLRLQKAW